MTQHLSIVKSTSLGNNSPKRVKIINIFERGLHGAKFGDVLFGRPSGISVKDGSEHLKEVFFAFAL